MDTNRRLPLIIVEVAVLVLILAVVEETLPRVLLGLMVGLLLARSALMPEITTAAAAPEGLDERRHDHLFRHWVDVLLKKIREFHTVCQGVQHGGVNVAVGQLRLREIEKEIVDLMDQVTDSAKPSDVKRVERSGGENRASRRRVETYGEPTN